MVRVCPRATQRATEPTRTMTPSPPTRSPHHTAPHRTTPHTSNLCHAPPPQACSATACSPVQGIKDKFEERLLSGRVHSSKTRGHLSPGGEPRSAQCTACRVVAADFSYVVRRERSLSRLRFARLAEELCTGGMWRRSREGAG
jgi:hypothetical protein